MSCQTYDAGRRSSWMTLRYCIWNPIWPELIGWVTEHSPLFLCSVVFPAGDKRQNDSNLAAVAWMQPLLSSLSCVCVWSGGTVAIPSCLCPNPQSLWTLMEGCLECADRSCLCMLTVFVLIFDTLFLSIFKPSKTHTITCWRHLVYCGFTTDIILFKNILNKVSFFCSG